MLYVLLFIMGIIVGIIAMTICYYNGSIMIFKDGNNEQSITLNVVDEKKLFKQKYILLSVRSPR